jgi:hypothetical protein
LTRSALSSNRDDNGAFIVMFDPATHLPAAVRTRDFDGHMGDADCDAAYSDWRGVGDGGRLKQPFHVVYTLNGVNIFGETVDQVTVNAPLAPGGSHNTLIVATDDSLVASTRRATTACPTGWSRRPNGGTPASPSAM